MSALDDVLDSVVLIVSHAQAVDIEAIAAAVDVRAHRRARDPKVPGTRTSVELIVPRWFGSVVQAVTSRARRVDDIPHADVACVLRLVLDGSPGVEALDSAWRLGGDDAVYQLLTEAIEALEEDRFHKEYVAIAPNMRTLYEFCGVELIVPASSSTGPSYAPRWAHDFIEQWYEHSIDALLDPLVDVRSMMRDVVTYARVTGRTEFPEACSALLRLRGVIAAYVEVRTMLLDDGTLAALAALEG